jgi:hypothetical protein
MDKRPSGEPTTVDHGMSCRDVRDNGNRIDRKKKKLLNLWRPWEYHYRSDSMYVEIDRSTDRGTDSHRRIQEYEDREQPTGNDAREPNEPSEESRRILPLLGSCFVVQLNNRSSCWHAAKPNGISKSQE